MTATDDGTSLLRAIIAHPDEDTPRLMYADWLDENYPATQQCPDCELAEPDEEADPHPADILCFRCGGRGEVVHVQRAWAEFIRLQIELAGSSRPFRHTKDCPRYGYYRRQKSNQWAPIGRNCPKCRPEWLVERLRHLWLHLLMPEHRPVSLALGIERLRQLWQPPEPVDPPIPFRRYIQMAHGVSAPSRYVGSVPVVIYRRGFIERVTCPVEQFLEHGRALCASHPIMEVGFPLPDHNSADAYWAFIGRVARDGDGRIGHPAWPGIVFGFPEDTSWQMVRQQRQG